MRTDLDLETIVPQAELGVDSQVLMSFICPCCHQRLNVPTSLAGVAGPCPACSHVIRAPRTLAPAPPFSQQFDESTTEVVLPNMAQEDLEQLPEVTAGFSAVHRIAAPSADRLDDSWRERVKRERKQSKRRRRRHRFIQKLLRSPLTHKLRKIGIVFLSVVLIATIYLIFINHKGGGILLRKWFGH